MAIKQNNTWTVMSQAIDGSGCGSVIASRLCKEDAIGKARLLAKADPGTRFYVAEVTFGVYQNRRGELSEKTL